MRVDDLPSNPADIVCRDVVDWVSRHLGDDDGAVFLAGNGFRSAGAIDELERRTGRLVLQANQVLLCSVLAATRTPLPISGFGRLFRQVDLSG